MRLAARGLAVAYTALVGVVPVLHAEQEAYAWTVAIEAGHHSGCAIGHDEATCPLHHLPRLTSTAAGRPTVTPAGGPLRALGDRWEQRRPPVTPSRAPSARAPPVRS